ncbi:hypothetical protein [Candidatus Protofrankia californiensis]|uniref:hypothetical protein n=1 Tax=Candidatus Protofrankia californiensis TaxID=1839754 RepID=UPI0013ED7C75|nr:hypothetical protein [Candidatus Protofrankia californiensis]
MTVRRCDSENPDRSTGDPLPVERDWMLAHGIPGRPEDHLLVEDEFTDAMSDLPEANPEANEVAAAISLDVGWHHPDSAEPHGLPLLALLPGTAATPLPPGRYEI